MAQVIKGNRENSNGCLVNSIIIIVGLFVILFGIASLLDSKWRESLDKKKDWSDLEEYAREQAVSDCNYFHKIQSYQNSLKQQQDWIWLDASVTNFKHISLIHWVTDNDLPDENFEKAVNLYESELKNCGYHRYDEHE
jgi:hypothetical protein